MLNLRGTLMTLFGDHLRLESQLVAYLALVALSQLLQPLPPLALQLRHSLINWTLPCICIHTMILISSTINRLVYLHKDSTFQIYENISFFHTYIHTYS